MTSTANIKIHSVRVDTESIDPCLRIRFELIFRKEFLPVQISGRILTNDHKVVGYFSEYQIESATYNEINIASIKNPSNQNDNYHGTLHVVLSRNAIDYIEAIREKQIQNDVNFTFQFMVKFIEVGDSNNNPMPSVRIQYNDIREQHNIKQSDWVRNFAPLLGIGKFLLLELKIPETKNVKAFWKTLYTKLSDNVHEMESCLRSGDWYKTMTIARRYYENIKIGDNKAGSKKFKEEFDKLMFEDAHSKEGVQNLYDAIWNLFEFLSKYLHEKDKHGNHQAMPQSTKEDAYFAYALAVGLLNLIGKKLSDTP